MKVEEIKLDVPIKKLSDDQISYSISGDGCTKIIFWTDDERIFGMVNDYIRNVIDAVNYRRQLRQVRDMGKRL